MNLSSHVPRCSSSAKSPIASKSPEKLIATGNLKAGWAEIRIPRSVEFSSATAGCIPWRMDTATEKLVATKEESGDVDLSRIWNWERSRRRSDGETGLLMKQLRRNPMHPVNQTPGKSKSWKNRMVTQSSHVSSHSSSYGSSLLDRQEYLRTRKWRPYGRSGREYGHLGHLPELLLLFKQQFILDKTMKRIYDTWRIIVGKVWESFPVKLENSSVNKKKSLV